MLEHGYSQLWTTSPIIFVDRISQIARYCTVCFQHHISGSVCIFTNVGIYFNQTWFYTNQPTGNAFCLFHGIQEWIYFPCGLTHQLIYTVVHFRGSWLGFILLGNLVNIGSLYINVWGKQSCVRSHEIVRKPLGAHSEVQYNLTRLLLHTQFHLTLKLIYNN